MLKGLNPEKIFRDLSIFKIIIFFIIFLICLRIIEQLFGNFYDWDIDHLIYYGGRLLEGELNYTKEFDDKLPIMQYLFLIPAYLKNNKIWTLFSITLSILSSKSIYKFLMRIFKLDWKLTEKINTKKIAFSSAIIYLFLLSSLQGSFSHINAVATSFSILSITTYFNNAENNLKNIEIKKKFFPALLASFAISMRPYFLPSILLTVVWHHFRSRNFFKKILVGENLKILLKNLIIYTLLIAFFGFLINCLPYIFTGNLKNLFKGIYLNSLPLHPTWTLYILKVQLQLFFSQGNIQNLIYLSFLFPFIIICSEFIKIKDSKFKYSLTNTDLIFVGVLSPLLVELVILSKHFWPHYLQFFSGYASISLGFSLAIIKSASVNNLEFKILKSNKIFFNIFLITLLIFIGRGELSSSGLKLLNNTNNSHPKYKELLEVRNFLDSRRNTNKKTDFLFPRSMYVHWNLKEPRRGFPSAAHFNFSYFGYWENIKMGIFDEEDYSKDGICKMMIKYGPSIFFAYENSVEYKCFDQNNSRLNKKILNTKNRLKHSLYVFFR